MNQRPPWWHQTKQSGIFEILAVKELKHFHYLSVLTTGTILLSTPSTWPPGLTNIITRVNVKKINLSYVPHTV